MITIETVMIVLFDSINIEAIDKSTQLNLLLINELPQVFIIDKRTPSTGTYYYREYGERQIGIKFDQECTL